MGTPTEERQRPASVGAVDERTVAIYRSARAFLIAEWIGALMVVASFTQLYIFVIGPYGVAPVASVIIGGLLLALGGTMFWKSRAIYLSLDFPWKRRWEIAATVVATSGAVFWAMFVLIVILARFGVNVLG